MSQEKFLEYFDLIIHSNQNSKRLVSGKFVGDNCMLHMCPNCNAGYMYRSGNTNVYQCNICQYVLTANTQQVRTLIAQKFPDIQTGSTKIMSYDAQQDLFYVAQDSEYKTPGIGDNYSSTTIAVSYSGSTAWTFNWVVNPDSRWSATKVNNTTLRVNLATGWNTPGRFNRPARLRLKAADAHDYDVTIHCTPNDMSPAENPAMVVDGKKYCTDYFACLSPYNGGDEGGNATNQIMQIGNSDIGSEKGLNTGRWNICVPSETVMGGANFGIAMQWVAGNLNIASGYKVGLHGDPEDYSRGTVHATICEFDSEYVNGFGANGGSINNLVGKITILINNYDVPVIPSGQHDYKYPFPEYPYYPSGRNFFVKLNPRVMETAVDSWRNEGKAILRLWTGQDWEHPWGVFNNCIFILSKTDAYMPSGANPSTFWYGDWMQ